MKATRAIQIAPHGVNEAGAGVASAFGASEVAEAA